MRADQWADGAATARVAARVRGLVGGAPGDADDRADGFSRGFEDGDERAPDPPTRATRIGARLPVRLDPGRRGALAVGVAVLVAAVLTGGWLLSDRPQAMSIAPPTVAGARRVVGTAVTSAPTHAPSPAGTAPSASSSGGEVVVDVAGKVHRPGLYHLPAGARIDDAITAAGGALRGVDLSSLNLAATVADGQQIAVGVRGSTGGVPVGGDTVAAAGSSAASTVDLNTATLEQVETLPGIGPVLGQQILDYRTQHGSFTSIDQLKDVSGIGDVRFGELQPLVTL